MDRLLFLYRSRVLDRFYPPRPFAQGKPQAHWLLDEAGAHIVAACLGIDRRQLPWRRRENWGHASAARAPVGGQHVRHRPDRGNAPHPHLGVAEWQGSGTAKDQMPDGVVLVPDAGFLVSTPAGLVPVCWSGIAAEILPTYRIATPMVCATTSSLERTWRRANHALIGPSVSA